MGGAPEAMRGRGRPGWARPSLALTAAALIAAIAAGCGGSDPASQATDTPRTTISDADYRAQADAICLRAERRLAQQPPAVGRGHADKRRLVARELGEFQALEPPADMAQAHEGAVTSLRERISADDAIVDTVGAGQGTTDIPTRLRERFLGADARADAAVRELGGTRCRFFHDAEDAATANIDLALSLEELQNMPAAGRPSRAGELTGRAREDAQAMREATGRMEAYELDDQELESARATLVRTGPPMARLHVELLGAVETRRAARGRTLAARLREVHGEFSGALRTALGLSR